MFGPYILRAAVRTLRHPTSRALTRRRVLVGAGVCLSVGYCMDSMALCEAPKPSLRKQECSDDSCTLPEALVGVLPGRNESLKSVAPITGKVVDPNQVDMVLFHGGCPDGFAAAFAAFLTRGEACEYIGIGHAKKRLPDNVDGKTVAILDFSFPPAMMRELMARAKAVIVLDHHASAQIDLKDLPDENKVFEMSQSGATLSWDFFADAGVPCPLLLRYIEDKDIWRWSLRNSASFSAAREVELHVPAPGVLNAAHDFAPWLALYQGGDDALAELVARGSAIVQYQEQLIGRACRSARKRRLRREPDQVALVVNSSVLASEIGNVLASRGIDEGVSYAIVARYIPSSHAGEGRWGLSLRSLCGHDPRAADVSLIAKKYGGGGHRAAAGMGGDVTDLEQLFVLEEE